LSNRARWLCANPRCGAPHQQRRVLGVRRGIALVVMPTVDQVHPLPGGAIVTCPACGTKRTWTGPVFRRLDVIR